MSWYDKAIIYQIYPKSFQDTNNDGIGDLKGVTKRLDYIKDMGFNTIWLNPIFVSPQVDNGYDVSNYFAIDPSLGDTDDFSEMITKAHQLGLHIILDLPINHTSDQHPWFKDAVNNANSIFKDYYIWHDAVAGHEPNNWGSFFGGSVWEKNPTDAGEYYFHLFDKRMPDLNWKNPEVQKSVADIAKFWLEKGVDGFRLDAFIHIAKANLEQNSLLTDGKFPIDDTFYAKLPAVKNYMAGFVKEIKDYNPDAFLFGEASSAKARDAAEYTRPDGHVCDVVVNSDNYGEVYDESNQDIPKFFQNRQLSLPALKQTYVTWESVLDQVSLPTLTWGNHDISRVLDRLNLPVADDKVTKLLAMMLFLQRGIPVIYYGEEIGMHGLKYQQITDFDDQRALDLIKNLRQKSYDDATILKLLNNQDEMTARGPMQWDTSEYHGFSTHQPWNWAQTDTNNVDQEIKDSESIMTFYQALLRVKKHECFTSGNYQLLITDPKIYAYIRQTEKSSGLVIANFSDQKKTFTLPKAAWKSVLTNATVKKTSGTIELGPWGCCALESKK
ncbi:glycoside hydrolase family 13 protein [Companilactobacillus nantensis]|uniref:Oligo-1,6-glucosidase n=1 Tax=Companilactobacillus nantensis DSM 16982 TaxID=1423774 RepID=A0A0R1WWL6_9LACO|nr:alpha-glucosidase [Companilactobacillus nantensis]KRM18716.1 oligo-1,6-glucosidase [Companilactobacillus nantensis DSM 16982]GEO63094.1 alpha-glucosidase [Companilactobacillus nantensis]